MKLKSISLLALTSTILIVHSAAAEDPAFLAADTDKNGQLSELEFQTAMAKLTAKPKFDPAIARSPSVPKPITPRTVDRGKGPIPWLEKHVALRKSFFNDEQINDPAKLSWTKSKGEDPFYNFDLAVMWMDFVPPRVFTPFESFRFAFSSTPFFEAHVTNRGDTEKKIRSQNVLTYGLPLSFDFLPADLGANYPEIEGGTVRPPKRFVTGHNVTILPQYRTDRHNGVKAFEVVAAYTPITIPMLRIGVSKPLFGKYGPTVRWRPFLGLESGRYLDENESLLPDEPDDYTRVFARLHGEVEVTERFSLVGDYTWRRELQENDRDFHYSELSAVLALDDYREVAGLDGRGLPAIDEESGKWVRVSLVPHFSVGVTWKRGEDAPFFADVDLFTAWIGAKF